MPLNVRRFCTFSVLVLFAFLVAVPAQTAEPTPAAEPVTTSGDVMRARIAKAKALIVVRNYGAAVYELDNIRKETSDPAVQAVVNVLLMNSYLEQGDYKRAQDLLTNFYNAQKSGKPNAAGNYSAVAGQIVKGARTRAERFSSLGLSVSDKALPGEAVNDLDKLRELLESVVTQSREIAAAPARSAEAMALHEEASVSRAMLARDDYDSRRWKNEIADTREQMARSQSVVLSAVSGEPAAAPAGGQMPSPSPANTTALASSEPSSEPQSRSVRERQVSDPAPKVSDISVASAEQPVYIPMPKPTPEPQRESAVPREASRPMITVPSARPTDPASGPGDSAAAPLDVGAMLSYATKQSPPVYPAPARSARQTGTVKVEFIVDESGKVAQVQRATGPVMLQNAAKDAIRKWEFRPFVRDGQPVRAAGFVSFNFSL